MSTPTVPPSTDATPGHVRHLGIAAFVGLVIVYLIILQGLGKFLGRGLDTDYAAPSTINEMWRTMTVPVAVSVVLVYAVVAWLGWWRPVWVDDRPVQRWLIVVPILMIVSILAVTDYAGLADHGLAFTLMLLLTCLLVGLGEETMFRGIGVTCMRTNGFSEAKVALWSTVIFGVAHATNLLSEGVSAFAQVFATIIAGYFFYIIRRRTSGLLVPVLVHALWDFSLISGLTSGALRPISGIAMLTMAVLAITLVVRRRHIEPSTGTPAADPATRGATEN
ncbi:CPBP family intramembrane glutamic endopeptidase [Gordonia insulae]|uniref:CAAX prenyl protease 2/Lysostaphin resistance protein A-like domain-containing protein n=1 Tax=Gordonia insulae TaxID=2420509 RepID=A0A3G8JG66_9ACTN|nr:CPBP family intramembrane glutamic endopeptidase [Gordonia insulae]AZG44077.1 hypothetical protein D7316_00657 [Gordonia insulae]